MSGLPVVHVGANRVYPVSSVRSMDVLRRELSFPNPAYRDAIQQGRTPAPGTPAFLQLFDDHDGLVTVPRHYRPALAGAVQEIQL